ncbi:hypothetical protein SpAn4DRAFT_5140 [Sporomusa ovata]|uniref:Uncharacterized protein n=1 Tax=Sporomusa ovata TaxID=2378 RepID=A0A0U1L2A9_9FIRM|nr:hypothetical protein SpAn4DRAFT_5140 [Sporomusa ovata]
MMAGATLWECLRQYATIYSFRFCGNNQIAVLILRFVQIPAGGILFAKDAIWFMVFFEDNGKSEQREGGITMN